MFCCCCCCFLLSVPACCVTMNSGPCSPVVGGFCSPSFSLLVFVWAESVVGDVRHVRNVVSVVFGEE